MERMDDNCICKIYNYEPEGRRNVGRPRSRWKDQDKPNGERNEPMTSYLDADDDDDDDGHM
jgi:hypothetical protein